MPFSSSFAEVSSLLGDASSSDNSGDDSCSPFTGDEAGSFFSCTPLVLCLTGGEAFSFLTSARDSSVCNIVKHHELAKWLSLIDILDNEYILFSKINTCNTVMMMQHIIKLPRITQKTIGILRYSIVVLVQTRCLACTFSPLMWRFF